MSGRRLVANLFFEGELARAIPAEPESQADPAAPNAARARLPRPRSTPSRAALERAAAYGILMRAFARDGDRLWLPAPIDPAQMPDLPGLPRPILESGPLAALPACEETLAWGESPALAELRARGARRAEGEEVEHAAVQAARGLAAPRQTPGGPAAVERAGRRGGPPWPPSPEAWVTGRPQGGAPTGLIPGQIHDPGTGTIPAGELRISGDSDSVLLAEALWDLAPASPSIVARVHHRAFALKLAQSLGCALPGARMIDSLEALDAHLRAGAAPERLWVVKAPLSASGRDRYIERGSGGSPPLDDPALRSRLERLFATHGPLLFEPWMERTEDFGACALLTPRGLRVLGFHRLHVDLRGQFAGIEIDLDVPGAGLDPDEETLFTRTVEAAGAALAREGYSGPFGLDAWRCRDGEGTLRFHPLGEINARLTFGFVARALAERGTAGGMFGAARRFRLDVSGGTPAFHPLQD